jgi:hypothetical protein
VTVPSNLLVWLSVKQPCATNILVSRVKRGIGIYAIYFTNSKISLKLHKKPSPIHHHEEQTSYLSVDLDIDRQCVLDQRPGSKSGGAEATA